MTNASREPKPLPTWDPGTWRSYPAAQQPTWPDSDELEKVEKELASLPPLVFAGEARELRSKLAAVSRGEAFLLQAGDCAESFDGFNANAIRDKLRVILQVAVVLTYSSGVPTVKVGRIAGQFAKPRSKPTETIDGTELPSFLGHMVNDVPFSSGDRTPQAARLLRAYHQSSSTLNLLRAFTKGGFADLHRVQAWNQEFVGSSPEGRRYERLAAEIDRALRFMEAAGISSQHPEIHEADFYTSHEALILQYEEALTRRDSLTDDWYDCSAHMVWIGERTRQVDGAHIEFMRGVKNPIGCKVGPSAAAEEIVALCDALDPGREPGRLTLISRMGADAVADRLPPLLEAVRDAGHPVVWACDPMHGNTFTSDTGHKTRDLDDILAELAGFFAAHRQVGTFPGGVHLELTGDDVTECLGGGDAVATDDLGKRYETMCDPRLNARQSLDLAFRTAELLQQRT
ncbi:MAG: 3-deoxy-7-phosphoheptulonate synthase class II [Acidimicrobiia bacterium]|nr:3-deoxy-7-phosphoheptulonate synthase class II [Acidimicrobiia bacterium]